MAEQKASVEREYIVPLRQGWMNKANYKRTRKAVMTLKEFVARHMKIVDRDLDKVKLDVYLNNEMWSRGSKKPPASIKVKVRKEGDIVYVSLAEPPKHHAFEKAKHVRRHVKTAKKETVEEKKEEKTEEEKKVEAEKEKSAAISKEKIAEQKAQEFKHTTKTKETKINRMALKK